MIYFFFGTPGEVCLEVGNSLGVEVKLSNMSLVSTGADLETSSSLVMLDTHQNTQTIILKAIPRYNNCLNNNLFLLLSILLKYFGYLN